MAGILGDPLQQDGGILGPPPKVGILGPPPESEPQDESGGVGDFLQSAAARGIQGVLAGENDLAKFLFREGTPTSQELEEQGQRIKALLPEPEGFLGRAGYEIAASTPALLLAEGALPALAARAPLALRMIRAAGVGGAYGALQEKPDVMAPAYFAAGEPIVTGLAAGLRRLFRPAARAAAEGVRVSPADLSASSAAPDADAIARKLARGEGVSVDELEALNAIRGRRGLTPLTQAEVREAGSPILGADRGLEPDRLRNLPDEALGATPPLEESAAAPGVLEARAAQATGRILERERRLAQVPFAGPERRGLAEAVQPPQPAFSIEPDEVLVGPPTRVTQPAGFFNLGALTNFVRRNFRTGGNLPREVWNRLVERDGGVNASVQEMVFHIRDLMRGAEKVYGFGARLSLPDEAVVGLNAYLRGEAPVEALPEALRASAQNIRAHVDALSQKLIDSGAAEGKMALTIAANKGVYLTRTYELFENSKWASFAKQHPSMEPVRLKVKALLRSQNPQAADGEIEAMFNDLLAKAEDGPFGILARRPGLAKNLSILQRRKDIPAEIRALWGEISDPMAAYARSVQKISSLLETHRALVDMRDAGLGRFFFTDEMRGMAPDATSLIAGEGSEVLKPLNGLYTYPEIAQSLRDFLQAGPIDAFTRAWVKINATTKFSKVILSHVALMRNMLSNVGFAVTQGHWRAWKGATAARALLAQMNPFGLSGEAAKFGFNERAWQAYVTDLQRLGVVGDAARAHELRDIMQEVAKSGSWLDDIGGSLPMRLARKVVRGAVEVYRAGDDVWKIFAYENELARYKAALQKAGTSIPEDELKHLVAENVRLTYPTYSNIPRAIRALRRFPLLGPFVSFPWEVYRTIGATISLASREMANPALASVGRARLASAALGVGVGFGSISIFTKYLNGITNEVEEALRRFLPPWSQNSTLAYLNHDQDGNARVIDLSYTDPYSYGRDALTAAFRGEDWHAKLVGTVAQLLKPFASPEILTAKAYEAIKLWQDLPEGMPLPERLERVGNVIYEAFEPGSVNALLRLKEATQNPGRPYDQKYDPEVERMVNLTGARVTEVNPSIGLVFKARDYANELSKARQEEMRVARSRAPLDDAKLLQAQELASTIRASAFEEMRKDLQAARLLGKTDFDIRRALASAGLPNTEINALLLGFTRFRPEKISVEPGDPMTAEFVRRQLLLQTQQLRGR